MAREKEAREIWEIKSSNDSWANYNSVFAASFTSGHKKKSESGVPSFPFAHTKKNQNKDLSSLQVNDDRERERDIKSNSTRAPP